MPIKFDLNEYFLIASILVVGCVLYKQSRRWKLPATASITICLLNTWLVMLFDFSIGGPPYDVYDFMDSPNWELMYAIAQFMLYPMMGLIFVKGYVWWKTTKPYPVLYYILGWTLLSIGYEWVSVKAEVLDYNRWKLWHSFFVYLGTFLLNLWLYQLTQSYLKRIYPLRNRL